MNQPDDAAVRDRFGDAVLSLKPDYTQLFLETMERCSDEVLVNDASGRILFVNRRFREVRNLSQEAFSGCTIDVFKAGFAEIPYYVALCRVMAQKKPWQGKLKWSPPDGPDRVYSTTVTPVPDAGGDTLVFLSVRRDVTELESREKQLDQSRRMETIGTLAGGIAHDFNNILAGIVGYAELVKEDLELLDEADPKTHARLDNMISGAMRAKNLIHQILTFSRSGPEVCHPLSPGPLVKEVAQLLRASLPATIEIVLDLNTDAQVLAKPTHIHQIMMNLCTNARDAMLDAGGLLTISLSDTVGPGEASLPSTRSVPEKYVRLTVADTGPGINEKIRHKVLQPFFTTKSLEKGTGMGLSLVHGIVRELSGILEFRENAPQGAAFDIYLPFHQPAGEAQSDRQPSASVRGNGELILFVDDESDLVSIAEDGLCKLGYRVKGYDKSGEALAWFLSCTDTPDLMILDATMPELSGEHLFGEIRKRSPSLPALFITGASERMDEERATALGAWGLLYKPVTMAELSRTIRSILDKA